MEIVICPDADEVGRVAAAKVAQVCRAAETPVLGLATGSSPLAIYRHLQAMVADGRLDLSGASAFALDEYVGLDPAHPESYRSVIHRTVTEPLGLDPARVHVPDGAADDLEEAAAAYDRAIRDAGGVDVQILGIGSNGHIGFNEPTSSFASRTRIKTLAERTRLDNQRFFDSLEEVPTHCLTQGLGTIMEARHVLLVAQGANKAPAVAASVEGPVSSMWPASVLQFHQHATVVVDEEAAAQLQLADYYRHVYAGKPAWQRFA
ncbi:glucosamine-6-phosphate deaminase [Auraticoccus sp. F435]|uniref:Glucosamine-6-phosphate deaminase n=1 Tax=Auraticoccus cholistanensis TaxID=2656650 RepID=A0A6A9UXW8_9ACTN|nr:glucosamine-6-phosphate deaminase [Auraticoccus cholistanensis]